MLQLFRRLRFRWQRRGQPTILIGLGHRARSGKDTAADFLVANYGFKKIAFADLLKKVVNDMHGWDHRHAYGDLKEVVDEFWGYSPRHAYQKVGTEGVRSVLRDDFWIMAAWRIIQRLTKEGVVGVVVTDVRFPNEANFLRSKDALAVHVIRDLPPLTSDAHVSETAMVDYPDWDDRLLNLSTLKHFYQRIDEFMTTHY